MLITIYGIIIFMLISWIYMKRERTIISDKCVMGFSFLALITRHQITRKPVN